MTFFCAKFFHFGPECRGSGDGLAQHHTKFVKPLKALCIVGQLGSSILIVDCLGQLSGRGSKGSPAPRLLQLDDLCLHIPNPKTACGSTRSMLWNFQ